MFSICDTDPTVWHPLTAQPLWGLGTKEPGEILELLLPVVPHTMASVSVPGISRLMPASMKLAR